MIAVGFFLFVLAATFPALAQVETPSFHGSEAFRDNRLAGREMLDEKMIDLDGDGLLDALVVEKTEEGIGLSAWQARKEGDYAFLSRESACQAGVVAKFELLELGAGAPAVLLDVYEDSPDEEEHRVRLFHLKANGAKLVFESEYVMSHSEEDAGRPARRLVDLGGLGPGLTLLPGKNEWPDLIVRHDPKRIVLGAGTSAGIWFVIGIRERVFQARDGTYHEVEDRYLDFLQRVVPGKVTSTSHLPSSESKWEAASVTDARLDTAWVEGRPGPGEGESLTLSFQQPVPVRLVRLVPGCAGSESDWTSHNRIGHFSLMFQDGVVVRIPRGSTPERDPRVEAWSDFDLPGLGFGTQTMVFFREPITTSWVKVTIESVEKGSGEADETCLSEISVHQALVDRTDFPARPRSPRRIGKSDDRGR